MRTHRIARSIAIASLSLILGGCTKTGSSSSSSTPPATAGGSNAANAPNAGSAAPPGASDSNPAASASNAAPTAPAAPAVPEAPPPIRVPSGTVLTVTLDQSVSTKDSQAGDRFLASLAEPVTVEGRTVLPAGTGASGTITLADSAGRVKGGAALALTLDSITLQGKKYSVETNSFEEAGKGRGKRTAIGAGGGAAFGAIIGALAGGGKGAAIGAVAGGGAGTAGTAFTGKRDFSIPAETRLHFKLVKPLRVSP